MKRRVHSKPLEDLFEQFPRGIALIELIDPKNISTWRLTAINELAASLVTPSIDTFVSARAMRLGPAVDLPTVYREIVAKKRVKTIGMVEVGVPGSRYERLYTICGFPTGEHGVGILFEDARTSAAARSARVFAEQLMAQTCEFLGAILWKADPETLQFTYVSPQAEVILGYWQERWTAETNFWKNHLHPEDRERVADICERIRREKKRRDFEFRMMSVHGQILWFHAAASITERADGRPELAGVMNDITDLKRAEERIRALSSRLMRLQDEERRHISRELHDSLGQYLTSIKINLELVRRESQTLDELHRALLTESSETLERCVQEVRSVSYVLHPPMLDELGLLAALRWYTAGFGERSGIPVHLNAPSQFSRLPDEMELALFRIVQESLTNVQRHSRSEAAWVTLSEHEDRAEVRVTDSGVGLPSEIIERIKEGKTIEGIGLRGMYERMRELGGQLEIESGPSGTALYAAVPLQTPDENAIEDEEAPRRRRRRREGDNGKAPAKLPEAFDVRIERAGGSDGTAQEQNPSRIRTKRSGRRAPGGKREGKDLQR